MNVRWHSRLLWIALGMIPVAVLDTSRSAAAKSVHRMAIWIPVEASPPVRTILHLASHPTNGSVVAVGGRKSVFLSRDRGRSWTRILKMVSAGGEEDDGTTGDLSAGSGFTSEKQAARNLIGELVMGRRRIYVGSSRGLYVGPTNGERLRRATGLPVRLPVASVSLNLVRSRQVFAAAGRWVIRSTDGGRTWQRVSTPSAGKIVAVRTACGRSRHLMAVTRKHVFISSNLGRSWKVVPSMSRPVAAILTARNGAGVRLVTAGRNGLTVMRPRPARRAVEPRRIRVWGSVKRLSADIQCRPFTFWAAGERVWLAHSSRGSLTRVDLGLDGSGQKLVASRPQTGGVSKPPLAWAATTRRLYRLRWVKIRHDRRSFRAGGCGPFPVARPAPRWAWKRRIRAAPWLPTVKVSASLSWNRSPTRFGSNLAGTRAVSVSGFQWGVFAMLTWALPSLNGPGRLVQAAHVVRQQRKHRVKSAARARQMWISCRSIGAIVAWGADLTVEERAAMLLQKCFLQALLSAGRSNRPRGCAD